MTRAQQLANAYLAIAKLDHYMVGIVETVTDAERDEAEQILINGQNATKKRSAAWRCHDLALDVLEQDRRMERS